MDGIYILLNDALQGTNRQTTLIVQKGVWPHALGRQILDDSALERIVAQALSNGIKINVDYNHSQIKGAITAEDGKAAGWIEPSTLRITEEGITGEIVWNEPAANMIRAKEYLYLSPVFNGERTPSGEFRITRLVNLALVNVPNIPQKPLVNEFNNPLKETTKMDLAKLAQALGLPATSTEEEVMAAALAMKNFNDAANGVYAKLAANDAATAMTRIIELQKPPAYSPGDIALLQTRLAALEKERGETIVNTAIAVGKLTPAQKAWAEGYYQQNPEGFKAFLANTVPVVPLVSAAADSGNSAVMTAEDRAVCAALGVNEDQFKKANGLN